MNKNFVIENEILTKYIGEDDHVVIPEGITIIGNRAFANCYSVESIVIPDSVTSIGYSAFYKCCSLESIVISNSVTSIEDYAFSNCYSLKNVVLPKKYIITKEQIKEILENAIIENRNSEEGLCSIVSKETLRICDFFLGFYFLPLFKNEIAIEKFNGLKGLFW